MVSPRVEDYLKTIYRLQDGDTWVAPSAVATEIGVKPPTVTKTLQRMRDAGLVDYERYRGTRLTLRGEERTLEVLRHHRLLELFLTEKLGYDWSEVHDEADVLEHYISEKLERRIAARLGFPTVDPHGTPIPTADLELHRDDTRQSLEQCREGDVVVVSEVGDNSPGVLAYLADAGVTLGTSLEVVEVTSFGMITFAVRETGTRLSLPDEAAANIYLSRGDELSVDESGRFSEVQ